MRYLLSILLISLTFHGNTQKNKQRLPKRFMQHSAYSGFGDKQFSSEKKKRYKSTHAETSYYTSKKTKRTKTNSITTHNNQYGKTVSIYINGTQVDTFTYLNDSLLIEHLSINKKKTMREVRTYDNGKVSTQQIFYNGKLSTKEAFYYTDFGKIMRSERTNLVSKQSSALHYYYSDQQKIVKTEYYVNNTLKTTWDFSCKEAGEIEQKNDKITANQVCRYEEQNQNGNYILYIRQLYDGAYYLSKSFFTKDSTLYAIEKYYQDTILMHQVLLTPSFTTITEFSPAGKLILTHSKYYSPDKKLIEERRYSKNKFLLKKTYTYNPQNELLSETTSDAKGALNTKTYRYTPF